MTLVTVAKAALVMVCTLLSAGLPLFIKSMRATNAKKAAENEVENAKTEAEKAKAEAELAKAEAEHEKAYNDMLATAQAFVESAEKAFEGYDKILKAQGESAGAMKKDNVLSKLQTYALQRGYDFDISLWESEVEKIVAFTKAVNAKKKAQ